MAQHVPNWTEEEFKAYLLIYAANSDFYETPEEKASILARVNEEIYKKMHTVFEKENDYQRIQNILYCVDKFGYNTEKIESLKQDMKQVMSADGDVDELETNMFLALKHLI